MNRPSALTPHETCHADGGRDNLADFSRVSIALLLDLFIGP